MRRDWVFMSVFLAVLGLLGGQLFAGPFQGAAREAVTAPFEGGTLTSDLDLGGNNIIASSSDIDLDGTGQIVIDEDGNTFIRANADNQIEFKIGGVANGYFFSNLRAFFGKNVHLAGGVTIRDENDDSVTIESGNTIDFEGATILDGTVDGILTLTNQAGTDFTRLNFGGTTASFPALRRTGAFLVVRRADDTANASMSADQYRQNGTIGTTRGFVTGTFVDYVNGSLGAYAWVDNTEGASGTIDAAIVRNASGVLKLVNTSAPAPTDSVGASLLAFKTRTASAVSLITGDSNHLVGITDTSSVRTVTLATSTLANGRDVIVKDESGAAGTNNITIETEGSETIDGGATAVISSNFGVSRIYSDGTNWFTY